MTPTTASPLRRIRYIYDAVLPDTGADTEQVVNTVAALGRRGLDLRLLVPGGAGSGDADAIRRYYEVTGEFGVDLLRLTPGPRLFQKWGHALRAARHPRAREADLLYTRNLPALQVALSTGLPVAYEHFRPWGDQFPILRPWLRRLLRHPRCVAFISHSDHTRQSFLRLGAPGAKILVAHNGWDPHRLEPRLTAAQARGRLGLPLDQPIAVYSGRMNRKKGLDIVLAAARALPHMLFVLVGSEGDGPVETEARGLANVRIVPWLRFSELAPWLYAADVLLIPPSLAPLQRHGNTVLPLKLFLYLAAGRALLAPQAPDTAELLTDGQNAALVPPGDLPATVTALTRLAAEPARRDAIAAGARATAASLTWDARAERIHQFLQERLATRG